MMLRTSLFCFLLVSGAATSVRADAPTQVVRDESLSAQHATRRAKTLRCGTHRSRSGVRQAAMKASCRRQKSNPPPVGTYCKPCREEFPLLKQIDQQLRLDYKGDVQFLYVADASSNNEQMKTSRTKHHAGMPMGLLFRDAENKLSSELLSVLPQQQVQVGGRADSPSERLLSLPMTLCSTVTTSFAWRWWVRWCRGAASWSMPSHSFIAPFRAWPRPVEAGLRPKGTIVSVMVC